jgi:hypothetical protein
MKESKEGTVNRFKHRVIIDAFKVPYAWLNTESVEYRLGK